MYLCKCTTCGHLYFWLINYKYTAAEGYMSSEVFCPPYLGWYVALLINVKLSR